MLLICLSTPLCRLTNSQLQIGRSSMPGCVPVYCWRGRYWRQKVWRPRSISWRVCVLPYSLSWIKLRLGRMIWVYKMCKQHIWSFSSTVWNCLVCKGRLFLVHLILQIVWKYVGVYFELVCRLYALQVTLGEVKHELGSWELKDIRRWGRKVVGLATTDVRRRSCWWERDEAWWILDLH